MTRLIALMSLTATVGLASCGAGTGSGGSNSPTYVEVLDTSSGDTSALEVHFVDLNNNAVVSADGEISRASQTIEIADSSGALSDDLLSATLDAGGVLTIAAGGTDFVATYVIEPLGTQPLFGVLGVPTEAGDTPQNGAVTYASTDTASFQIVDGEAVYDLVGDISATARFGNGTVDLSFSSLDGTRLTGSAAPEDVTGVAAIDIAGSSISGNDFSGGSASLTSDQLSAGLSGAEDVLVLGSFYGPQADELGGVILIDDTGGSGNVLIQGWYTAD